MNPVPSNGVRSERRMPHIGPFIPKPGPRLALRADAYMATPSAFRGGRLPSYVDCY